MTSSAESPAQVTVRPAIRSDGETFLALVRGLAEYEKLEPPTPEGEHRLLQDAFGEKRRIEVLLAEIDGRAIGYAIFLETYSSFLALPTLYLEDLFVRPDARRSGAGHAVMGWLARETLRRGYGRLEWMVLDWNRLAIEFYDRLGATPLEKWLPYRLSGEALQRVAGET